MDVSTAAAPAASTATPAPVVIGSGESGATFDEMEAIDQRHKDAKRAQKTQAKEVIKETVKALEDKDKSKEEKKTGGLDAPPATAKETKKADPEVEQTGEEKEAEKLAKQAEAKARLIKGKLADKDIDLDPETVVPVKIDGKEELVKLKDLMSEKSGKVYIDKEISKLNLEKQTFHQKHQALNAKIKSVLEETDPELRFYKMATIAGKDPVAVRRQFLDGNMELLEKYYGMSEDERKADEMAYENKIIKHQLESKKNEETRQVNQQALESKIKELGKTHQISDDEFWGTFDKIKAAKDGGTFKEKITPELVAEAVVKNRLWDAAAMILDAAKDFPNEKRLPALRDLVEDAYKVNATPAEIKEVAEKLWGSKARETIISEKVSEQEKLRTGKTSSKKPDPSQASSEAVLFDEIM